MFNKSILPLLSIYVFTTAVFVLFRHAFQQHGFDWHVLVFGNTLVFAITMLSAYLLSKGLAAGTTAGFLQNTYGSILLKLFVLAIAAFVYIYTAKGNISKRAVFACMALYLMYTFVERRIIIQHSKAKRNEDRASATGTG